MKSLRERQGGQIRRLVRGRWFDRNPLRRPSDRAETVIYAVVLAGLLAGAPFAARAGGGFAHDLARHVQHAQVATERQVTAVTTQAAPTQVKSLGQTYARVTARWTAPDGKTVTAQLPVLLGTPAGARQQAWTTYGGQLAAPPLLNAQVYELATLGEVTSVLALVMAALLARALARHELDRRRYAAWDADWRAIDSRGTHRK